MAVRVAATPIYPEMLNIVRATSDGRSRHSLTPRTRSSSSPDDDAHDMSSSVDALPLRSSRLAMETRREYIKRGLSSPLEFPFLLPPPMIPLPWLYNVSVPTSTHLPPNYVSECALCGKQRDVCCTDISDGGMSGHQPSGRGLWGGRGSGHARIAARAMNA